jgi:signal transduction histidine kinase
MAATLLETLTLRGRLADRERAARAAGLDGDDLIESSSWLAPDAIAAMLTAAAIEVPVARAVGHRLIVPETMGTFLFTLGLATPEKAYRRVQSLLPREASDATWLTEEIHDESAWLSYRPHPDSHEGPTVNHRSTARAASCALRRGMLEAIPTLYGLLPATIEDAQCVARGDSVCRYRVEWQRSARRGLKIGIGVGSVLSLAVALGTAALGAGGLVTAIGWTLGLVVFVGALILGRSVDLAAQLNAVGGTRRGQLALFEQIDDQLATRLDALARVDAKLEEESTSFRVGLSRSHSEGGDQASEEPEPGSEPSESSERDRGLLAAAMAIHDAAGDLECWFDAEALEKSPDTVARAETGEERGLVREIRDWAARIADEIAPNGRTRRTVDLGGLVARGIAAVRPLLPENAVIRLEVDPDLEPVTCEPVQIEQVVIQLVRNAIEASQAVMSAPEATVSLYRVRSGVEIAVEDRGAGIDSSAVDEVFDPFFGEAPLGTHGGFGLPICLRIVEAHGGELRIEAEDRPGTRVSVFLPQEAYANLASVPPA